MRHYCLCMQTRVWYQYMLMLVNCFYIQLPKLVVCIFGCCWIGHWLSGWSSIQLVIGCNECGINPLLA